MSQLPVSNPPDPYPYDPRGRGQEEFSARSILRILFKHRWTLIAVPIAAVVTVLAGVLVTSPSYEVSAAVLVKGARAEVPLSPAGTADPMPLYVSEENLNSEIEILRSTQLLEEVVREADLAGGDPGLLGRVRGLIRPLLGRPSLTREEAAVVGLQQKLRYRAIPRSNVIEVVFETEDPEHGEVVVQQLLDAYLQQRTRVHQVPQAASFFGEEASAARARLEEAEAELESFLVTENLSLPLEPQAETVLRQESEYERQLGEAIGLRNHYEEKVRSLRESLSDVSPRLASAYVQNQDVETQEIRRGLVALQLERDRLLQSYAPGSYKVQNIDKQIALAEERLGEAEAKQDDVIGTEVNEVYQRLEGELLSAESELEGQRVRIGELRRQLAEAREEVASLNSHTLTLARLQREAREAEEAYLLYRRKSEENRISLAMDQQQMVNVSVARPPSKPLQPKGPGNLLLLVLAAFLGILGGLAFAFVREMVDQSLATPEDVERKLGLKHIASIRAH